MAAASRVGELEILVIGGAGLDTVSWWRRDADITGRYVVLELAGRAAQRTKIQAVSKEVDWNERSYYSNVWLAQSRELVVRLLDRNAVSGDIEMGRAQVSLSQLDTQERLPLSVQLTNKKGKKAGLVQLLLAFKPRAGETTEGNTATTAAVAAPGSPTRLLGVDSTEAATALLPPTPSPNGTVSFNPLWQQE